MTRSWRSAVMTLTAPPAASTAAANQRWASGWRSDGHTTTVWPSMVPTEWPNSGWVPKVTRSGSPLPRAASAALFSEAMSKATESRPRQGSNHRAAMGSLAWGTAIITAASRSPRASSPTSRPAGSTSRTSATGLCGSTTRARTIRPAARGGASASNTASRTSSSHTWRQGRPASTPEVRSRAMPPKAPRTTRSRGWSPASTVLSGPSCRRSGRWRPGWRGPGRRRGRPARRRRPPA